MPGMGTATIDFGAFPGSHEASVNFVDATVGAASAVEAYFMSADTTSQHTAQDHKYAGLFIALAAQPTAGVGGAIHARAIDKMIGQYAVRWVWA